MIKSRNAGLIIFIFVSLSLVTKIELASAGRLIEVERALKKIYVNATAFEEKPLFLSSEHITRIAEKARTPFSKINSSAITVHIAKAEDIIIGYAMEDIVAGKWGLIHYLVGFDPQGIVVQVKILEYYENRGKPIAKRRFLRQYKGKSQRDPVQLHNDIDGITGATISSRTLTDGVRKLIFVLEEII